MPTLGVALITKNAAAHLAPCLQAVAWADRIVVLDSGSTDATLEIARAHGAEVHINAQWPGFGPQKNRVLALLDTDWILAIDADEVVSPQLAASVQQRVANTTTAGDVYSLSRLSNYCGRWMKHSGWYPDHVARLFRRGSAHYSDDLIHERLVYSGPAPALAGELLHYSFDNLDQVLDKVNRYSAAGAEQRLQRGQRASLGKAVFKGFWTFVRTYFFKAGFLDGREGFILAVSNAEGAYYRYLKLMYLQERP
ncbi:glycosyltransferase family 2 protein [Amantichitinum ursilacus]|uniref:Glycosyl transferase family 2 n=1 Tax=Amantichitinum ursilacus TaxID=857265 RepID=A0A0N0GMV4_9NEIS|nr:glycosyltransferase family 2 protein [Amantichitinum ursilacus]KPC52022.1 Glycosyl transferase family 2 [Amantichitinum ursilacus]